MSNKNIINIVLILVVVTILILLASRIRPVATTGNDGGEVKGGCCANKRN